MLVFTLLAPTYYINNPKVKSHLHQFYTITNPPLVTHQLIKNTTRIAVIATVSNIEAVLM